MRARGGWVVRVKRERLSPRQLTFLRIAPTPAISAHMTFMSLQLSSDDVIMKRLFNQVHSQSPLMLLSFIASIVSIIIESLSDVWRTQEKLAVKLNPTLF
jgi:lipopolysaccharide/colanic/teichoic acid biosynthesis glycosyltransferase